MSIVRKLAWKLENVAPMINQLIYQSEPTPESSILESKISRSKLKGILQSKSMSSRDLSKLSGVDRLTIEEILKNQKCSFTIATKIADALEVPLDDLTEYKQHIIPPHIL